MADVPPLLSSFSDAALAAARDAVPALARALLVDAPGTDWQARLAALDCMALDANHQSLTPELVRAARAAGYRVLCYTPNDPQRVRELAGWDVDGIITDAIDHVAADALPPAPPLP